MLNLYNMKSKVMTHLMLLISHSKYLYFFYKLGQSLRGLTSDKFYMRTKKDRREYIKHIMSFRFGWLPRKLRSVTDMHGRLLRFSMFGCMLYQLIALVFFFTLIILCCFIFSKLLYSRSSWAMAILSLKYDDMVDWNLRSTLSFHCALLILHRGGTKQSSRTWGILFPSIVLYRCYTDI